jgi:hypothetical protein
MDEEINDGDIIDGDTDESNDLPEGQRIELMKASERLNSIGERILETCPNVDHRALDAIFIAASLLEQQMNEGILYHFTDKDGDSADIKSVKPKEVQKGPAHNMPFKFLNENLDEKDNPSVDDLEKWFKMDND